MEPASPARLYATAVGVLLILLGIVGFFYGSSFGSPGTLDHTLGALRTNGWMNLLWAALGALGLLLALLYPHDVLALPDTSPTRSASF